ncbi:MAG: Na/Pi cotransporter family protein [Gammaproteobacteria bacterium]|nr:Na/Pi cotransporter family protein [Gammaproteobacteria bacterium]
MIKPFPSGSPFFPATPCWHGSARVRPLARWLLATLLSIATGLAWAEPATVTTPPVATIDWEAMILGLLGGLALFLFGMDQMSDALKAVAGERMKDILARLTANRWLGVVTGALVTAVIQSSSVTTVLVVGFITAGFMTLTQSIGVIMGANIGSTLTAQIIAFQVNELALLLIAVGFLPMFLTRKEPWHHYGAATLGIGLIFFGMSVMSEAMAPLRGYPPFLDLMRGLEQPAIGILVGLVFTALIQSSAATTGIVIVLAGQGLINLPAGIALALGANIGTCVTALLACIGKPREAVRAALVHLIFNVAGVLIWFELIGPLAQCVAWLSPAHPELTGVERLAAEAPRQIANAHSLFNIANTLLFIGFTRQFARLVIWLVPERPEEEERVGRARYLDEELLATPALALDRVRMEALRMGDRVQEMLARILPAIIAGNRDSLAEVKAMDDAVDSLHAQIIDYLGKISRLTLTEAQTADLIRLMSAVNDLENIGDVIETNLVVLGNERIDQGLSISQPTREVLNGFHRAVTKSVGGAVQAVAQKNVLAAQTVMDMKQEINRIADSAALHQARRLVAAEPKRIPAYTIEMDIMEKLKRIYYFAKRMAKSVGGQPVGQEVD